MTRRVSNIVKDTTARHQVPVFTNVNPIQIRSSPGERHGVNSESPAEAGATMTEVVDSVRRVTDIMSEIMAATQEQSAGIEQVNQAVGQMDEVTQQNAALVEEASAAAASMDEQAAGLLRVVSVFKLAGKPEAAAAKKAAPAVRKPQPKAAPLRAAPRPALATASDWEAF